jgi:hypothetical protein
MGGKLGLKPWTLRSVVVANASAIAGEQLGDVAGRLNVLDIGCGRCERHGRLNTARLLAEHGPDAKMRA